MSNSNEILKVFDHVLSWRRVDNLKPYVGNARTHNSKQIRQIAASIGEFGFTVPVLIDAESTILSGHARVEAAKHLGMDSVPVIQIDHLTKDQKRAYIIADNRLAELAGWDEELLAVELRFLIETDLEFDVGVTGFETAEIDLLIEGAEAEPDAADEIPEPNLERPAVSQPGDIWLLGPHRLLCGDARDAASYETLMAGQSAQMVFVDPPYNVPVSGHVCGLGKVQHQDFAMATGEMSEAEFIGFLETTLGHCAAHSIDGAINFICMDWRHMGQLLMAGREVYSELKNLCVWTKNNAGMGSFYRSRHELVFVYKTGTAPHINNFGLGDKGRYRTNVWSYAGMNSFGAGRDEALAMHPTTKPVALVADAMRDVSTHSGIVLDAFAGSGTTIIAAERTRRVGYALEVDPHYYVDVAIRRWQALTGEPAMPRPAGVSQRSKLSGLPRPTRLPRRCTMAIKYKVGYGKPPKKTRWKKGESGNPLGRPKGVKNMETVVRQEAYSKVVIKEGGKTQTVTKIEALMKRMMTKGIQGDNKAANIVLDLIQKHLPHLDPDAADRAPLTDEELKILSNYADFLEFVEAETDETCSA